MATVEPCVLIAEYVFLLENVIRNRNVTHILYIMCQTVCLIKNNNIGDEQIFMIIGPIFMIIGETLNILISRVTRWIWFHCH